MTASTSPKPKWIIAVGMPLLIFLGCFLVTLTTQFKANKDLFSNEAGMMVYMARIYSQMPFEAFTGCPVNLFFGH